MNNLHKGEIIIKKKGYGTKIPRHEIEALARCLLPEIQAFFQSEDGKKEFEEWKRQRVGKQKDFEKVVEYGD